MAARRLPNTLFLPVKTQCAALNKYKQIKKKKQRKKERHRHKYRMKNRFLTDALKPTTNTRAHTQREKMMGADSQVFSVL